MKKIYSAPQTDTVELIGANTIMAGSGLRPINGIGTGKPSGGMM